MHNVDLAVVLRGVGAGIKMERCFVSVLVLIVAAVASLGQGETLPDGYDEDDLFYHGGLPLPTSDDGDLGKIFDGQNAKENYYPFVVFLGIPNIAHICTGSLLSGKWVLTAAHCTYRGATHVFAGVYDRSEPLAEDEQYPIAEVIRHPNYTVFSNDIALVKLSNPVNLTSPAASKVALVKSDKYMSQVLDNKKKCRVLGWGAVLTPTRGWKATNTLQLLKLKFVSEAETLSRGYFYPFFEGTMNVEALEYEDECEYGSTCIGDDGAPIVCKKGGKWLQVGVQLPGLSQEGCYTGAKAAVNLNQYYDWIKSITKRK